MNISALHTVIKMLPNDLKDYRAEDSFQIIPPDLAVLLLVFGIILGYILGAVS